ncbi:trehalase family glycosidase, partial [Prolixibacteraceae bacterium]|nr:trehalase family glycosidase [Prolixibacteraceae bacterium]
MNLLKQIVLLTFTLSCMVSQADSLEKWGISYQGKAPKSLIGNGKEVYITTPLFFQKTGTQKIHGTLLDSLGMAIETNQFNKESKFYPSAAVYHLSNADITIEILYASTSDDPFVIFVRTYKNSSNLRFSGNKVFLTKSYHNDKYNVTKYSSSGTSLSLSWDELLDKAIAPYTNDKMVLNTPNLTLNRAMAFDQYLIDLAYNGELIVCDMFRWRDIWSRDLGSGFGMGALRANNLQAVYDCIEYDLDRYANHPAYFLKTTKDASQGGSAEGLSLLTQLVWQYYLATGNTDWLKKCHHDLKPWVEQWIKRDYNHEGLIVDVTDWMDHSRHYLLPYGSQTLYSNALMVKLLADFANISTVTGHKEDAEYYLACRKRFVDGVNNNLWAPSLGAYANLVVNNQKDLRIASAANSLALIAKIPSPEQAKTLLRSLKEHNWREAGSLTMSPKMTHIHSDQNEHIWPWWNAVEAKAHALNGDSEGAVRLLKNCAHTLTVPQYPGLMEELMNKEGISEGGNAFATAAGSFIEAVYSGLFGIEMVKAKQERLRILPNIPKNWNNTSLKVPTSNGFYTIKYDQGKTTVIVDDPQIREVEVASST